MTKNGPSSKHQELRAQPDLRARSGRLIADASVRSEIASNVSGILDYPQVMPTQDGVDALKRCQRCDGPIEVTVVRHENGGTAG